MLDFFFFVKENNILSFYLIHPKEIAMICFTKQWNNDYQKEIKTKIKATFSCKIDRIMYKKIK